MKKKEILKMSNNRKNRDLTKNSVNVPSEIPLGPISSTDLLSCLPENEQKILLTQHIEGILNISLKAQELNVDSGCLKKTLDDLAKTTKEVTEGGSSATITHTQTTKVGRTEVIMGNTVEARSGKLTKSQAGIKDWTPIYIIAAIIGVIIIISIIFGQK